MRFFKSNFIIQFSLSCTRCIRAKSLLNENLTKCAQGLISTLLESGVIDSHEGHRMLVDEVFPCDAILELASYGQNWASHIFVRRRSSCNIACAKILNWSKPFRLQVWSIWLVQVTSIQLGSQAYRFLFPPWLPISQSAPGPLTFSRMKGLFGSVSEQNPVLPWVCLHECFFNIKLKSDFTRLWKSQTDMQNNHLFEFLFWALKWDKNLSHA